MKIIKSSRVHIVLLIGILLLGFSLRHHNYKMWPRDGATFDEYAWTFLGMSLIDTRIPTSWSPHHQYSMRAYFQNTKGASFFLVTPYLEHPPLFGLVAGTFAKASGLKEFNDVSNAAMRPLALLLGMISILGVYLVSREMTDSTTALLAAFLYAIFPSVVIGSRLVQNENFFIPVFLLALYGTLRYIRTKNLWWGCLGTILASVLPLAKIPWVAAPLAITALLWSNKKYRDGWLVIFATAGFLSVFFLYGLRLDSQLFVNLWKLQLARYDLNFDSVFALFRDPLIADRYFLDGLIFLGLLCLPLVFRLSDIRLRALHFGFLAYFAIFLLGIPNEPGHGWYRYPLYPFLAMSIAIIGKKYFSKEPFVTFLFLTIPGLAALSMSWQKVFGFSFGILRAFLLASFISLLPFLFPQPWVQRFSKYMSFMVLFFVIGITIWSGYLYTEQ